MPLHGSISPVLRLNLKDKILANAKNTVRSHVFGVTFVKYIKLTTDENERMVNESKFFD